MLIHHVIYIALYVLYYNDETDMSPQTNTDMTVKGLNSAMFVQILRFLPLKKRAKTTVKRCQDKAFTV